MTPQGWVMLVFTLALAAMIVYTLWRIYEVMVE